MSQVWLHEIQQALILFGDAKDKNMATRNNRQQSNTEAKDQVPEDDDTESVAVELDKITAKLFPEPLPLVRHRLSGIIRSGLKESWKRPHRLGLLANFFKIPSLVRLVHTYLGFKDPIKQDKHTQYLTVDMRSCLHIVADGFQVESYEELKARCGLSKHLEYRSSTYNENIYYEHYDDLADDDLQRGHFGKYRIGHLECLFVLWIPATAQL